MGVGGGGVEAHVLYGWSRELKNKQQNNVPTPKNNATAGYKGPVGVKKRAFERCRFTLRIGWAGQLQKEA